MQVKVSKYTEGAADKALRPNGLPQSLIKYDARQKYRDLGSIIEVFQTVKHPRSRIQETSDNEDLEKFNLDAYLPRSTPGRQPPKVDLITREAYKKARNSGRLSMAIKGKSWKLAEKNHKEEQAIEPEVLMTKDLGRSDSWDSADRERYIRQEIDLATTLERIEKNFVITDPRLPNNPIIFASDSFLELTEYKREEILGRNCRLRTAGYGSLRPPEFLCLPFAALTPGSEEEEKKASPFDIEVFATEYTSSAIEVLSACPLRSRPPPSLVPSTALCILVRHPLMARSLLALFQILGTQEILLLEYAIMRFQELLQAENNNSKEEQYLESLACSWKWNNAQTELSVVHAIFHSISIWCDSKLQDYYMNFSREPSTFGTVMNLVSVVGVPVMVDYGEIKVASTVDLESKMERMHPLALLAKELILVVERELTVYQPEFRHCCPAAGIVSATKLNKLYEEQLYYRPEILKVDNGFIRSVEPEGRFGQQSS